MAKRKQKKTKYVYTPAFNDAKPEDKGTVVSMARYRWKIKHNIPHEKVIRVVRFVWQRKGFLWNDRFRLHAYWLGRAMSGGFLVEATYRNVSSLTVTALGEELLKADREGRLKDFATSERLDALAVH